MPNKLLSDSLEVVKDQVRTVKSQAKQATVGVAASAVKQVVGTDAGIDVGDRPAGEPSGEAEAVETGRSTAGQRGQLAGDGDNPLVSLGPQQMSALGRKERLVVARRYREVQEQLLQEAIKRQQEPGKYVTAQEGLDEEDAARRAQGLPTKAQEKKKRSVLQRVKDMTMKGRGSGEKYRGMSG